MYIRTFIFIVLLNNTILISGCLRLSLPSKVTVQGQSDPLEKKVTVRTHGYSLPLLGGIDDWFFRGYYEKESEQVSYQVYIILNSNSWRYWDTARFLTHQGLKELSVSRVGSDVHNCSKSNCNHIEDLVLHIDQDTMNEWKKTGSVIRFSSTKVSGHRDIKIDPKEVREFSRQMDAILNQNKKQQTAVNKKTTISPTESNTDEKPQKGNVLPEIEPQDKMDILLKIEQKDRIDYLLNKTMVNSSNEDKK